MEFSLCCLYGDFCPKQPILNRVKYNLIQQFQSNHQINIYGFYQLSKSLN